jgi:hypothetical protein
MKRQLVFIHGRSQEGRDGRVLKGEWIAALRDGLAKSGLELPITEDDVRFPYYGDTLMQLVAGGSSDEVAKVIVQGTDLNQEERAFIGAILDEIRREKGIADEQIAEFSDNQVIQQSPLNWEWVQSTLKAIDKYLPFGSDGSIALFTWDVYQYLRNLGIRNTIEIGIRQAMKPDVPTVVVSHSLGTVVSYNLLRREGRKNRWVIPLYVTLGSPLAITAIKKNLAPNKHPECVGKWFNAMDERDVVALYPLGSQSFPIDPEIENKTDVDNHTSNRHGIEGYLDDKVVAKRIYDALVG